MYIIYINYTHVYVHFFIYKIKFTSVLYIEIIGHS